MARDRRPPRAHRALGGENGSRPQRGMDPLDTPCHGLAMGDDPGAAGRHASRRRPSPPDTGPPIDVAVLPETSQRAALALRMQLESGNDPSMRADAVVDAVVDAMAGRYRILHAQPNLNEPIRVRVQDIAEQRKATIPAAANRIRRPRWRRQGSAPNARTFTRGWSG